MSALVPLPMRWDGEAMAPLPRFAKVADAQFVIGQVYRLTEEPQHSKRSRDHYFAVVDEVFENLPPEYADRWATADHMRKHALIKAGYRDERTHVCNSRAEAVRLQAFLKPIDDYAIVTAREAVVTHYTAKSQSLKAMGAATFQESKTAVLAILAPLIGVDPEQLSSRSKDGEAAKNRPPVAA